MVQVQKADISETVLASGTLEALEMVSVGAQVSGKIDALLVDLGDSVTRGQLLARINSLTQQNNLKKAQAALANVKAQKAAKQASLRQAELDFTRQQNMFARNASSRQDYDAAEATLITARADIAALDAEIAQAEVAVDTAKVDMGYTDITAPMDGTVVAVPVKVGQTVNANQSTPTLVKVAQLDRMTVKAEISEADVVRVKPGQKVYFTILGQPDHRYQATLRAIEPGPTSYSDSSSSSANTSSSSSSSSSASKSAIYYNGLFDVENPDHTLRIDMTAEVSIILAEVKQALVIPASALGSRLPDGRYTVQVATQTPGQVDTRMVKVGINNNVTAQITEGLNDGEWVISTDQGARSAATSGERRGPPRGPMGF